MKESICHLLVLVLALTVASFCHGVVSYPMQEVNEAPAVNENMNNLPQSNLDARMRLYLLNWLHNVGALQADRVKAKRTCRLNAGLSHSCDYKDTLDAVHEGLYFGSDMTPGKK